MADDLVFYTSAEVADLLRLNPQVVARKLKAGEIPAYRIGREWRVERAQLMEWLERHSNRHARDPDRKVLDAFFDADGKLKALPAPRRKREIVLRRLLDEFTPGRTYPEKEVNEIIRRFHPDTASIRRELIEWKMLSRQAGVYRRPTATEKSAL